jgi:VanZ family protein
VVILGLGSGAGSSNETSRFIKPLLEFLFPGASTETLTIYHGYIRKLAHPTLYGILGILAARVFGLSHTSIRNWWFVLSIVLAIIVASVDEFNQSFNPMRTGSPFDVLLDVLGAFCGAILMFIFWRWRQPKDQN